MKINKNKQDTPSLYGFHAVREAWLNPERTIHALYLTDQAKSGFEPVLLEGKRRGLRRQPPIMLDKHRLEKMLPQGAVHQGVALAASPPEEYALQDLIIRAHSREGRAVLLMLDQVTDPHNVGAILRSACALGSGGVIMQRKHAPLLTGVLAKTACGAIEHIPVAFETNLSRSIEALKDEGFFIYGLDERGTRTIGEITSGRSGTGTVSGRHKDKDLLAVPPKTPVQEKILLVLGAEGAGIRHLVREKCDELVRLPTAEPIASLNVSNAAAVALYALLQG
ncbi:MAG: 23S rRNA (guanosine(2251)-2'-O)-methyltransferase RlmB [Alphaproteobacteria bacterium]